MRQGLGRRYNWSENRKFIKDRGWIEVVAGVRVKRGNGQSSGECGEEVEAVGKCLADM